MWPDVCHSTVLFNTSSQITPRLLGHTKPPDPLPVPSPWRTCSVLVTYAAQPGDKDPREKRQMKGGEIEHVWAQSAVSESRIIPCCHTLRSLMTHQWHQPALCSLIWGDTGHKGNWPACVDWDTGGGDVVKQHPLYFPRSVVVCGGESEWSSHSVRLLFPP